MRRLRLSAERGRPLTRCALAMEDPAEAFRREVEAERLLDDIEQFVHGLDGEG